MSPLFIINNYLYTEDYCINLNTVIAICQGILKLNSSYNDGQTIENYCQPEYLKIKG